MKFKLIIVDCFGPVVKSSYVESCKVLAKKFKMNWEEVYAAVYKKYFNMAAERKITQQDAWEMAIDELKLPISVKEIKRIHYDLMSLDLEFIKYIKKEGKDGKILLLSKNTRSQFSDIEKKLGFKKYFRYIINTWELGLPKASKETLLHIIKKFKVEPEEIFYVDDQIENLVEAEKIGIKTIHYQGFYKFKKEAKIYFK